MNFELIPKKKKNFATYKWGVGGFFFLQKIYSDFELQGVMEDKLNSKAYQTVSSRMQTEEATCALTMPSHGDDNE